MVSIATGGKCLPFLNNLVRCGGESLVAAALRRQGRRQYQRQSPDAENPREDWVGVDRLSCRSKNPFSAARVPRWARDTIDDKPDYPGGFRSVKSFKWIHPTGGSPEHTQCSCAQKTSRNNNERDRTPTFVYIRFR